MSGIESLAIALGAAVTKCAAKLWLGDRSVASDAAANAIDVMTESVSGRISQRKLRRAFEQLEEIAARDLMPWLEREVGELPENERAAAIECVRETFDRAALTDEDLFAFDLDAGYLDRHLRTVSPRLSQEFGLSEPATGFYDQVLRRSCRTLIQIITELPRFQTGALTTLLERTSETLEEVRRGLDRLHDRRSTSDFEADYRQNVLNVLGQMELFGAGLRSQRKYALSVGYLTLSLSTTSQDNQPTDSVVARTPRLLVRGEAGAGKTILLQWLAVQCAGPDAAPLPPSWNERVPFYLPLRGYVHTDLPAPEEFLPRIGRYIAAEMPPGWVQQQLRRGAVVLIDGVDELPEQRRADARAWLAELVGAFPDARYVVTSRPAAIESDWLADLGFADAELQPMTLNDVRSFVRRWHLAMRQGTRERDEWERLELHERSLLEAISERRALRRLATNPLLCALLCALHRDRPGEIPNDRMELYRAALQMLLGRRDRSRGVKSPVRGLGEKEQTLLLQDLAYWLVKEGESDADRQQVVDRITERLPSLIKVSAEPQEICTFLLERTGLLREPVAGRVDFIHRTFQEYLAAKAAVEADEIGLLATFALIDHWREVIVMAAGLATPSQTDKLLKRLLRPRVTQWDARDRLDPLAVACLETATVLDPKLRDEVEQRANGLIPPRTELAVETLVRVGDLALELLISAEYQTTTEISHAIDAAAQIGGEDAMQFLLRFTSDYHKPVVDKLLGAWDRFDAEEYAAQVLVHVPLGTRFVPLKQDRVPALQHLRTLRKVCLHGTFDDLAALRDLPRLLQLGLTAAGEVVDVGALAGRRKLRLFALPDQQILGEDVLGPDSVVIRTDVHQCGL